MRWWSFRRWAAGSVLFAVTVTALVIWLTDPPPPRVTAVDVGPPQPALGATLPQTPPPPPPVILRHHPGESARDPASGTLLLTTEDGGGTVYVAADTRVRVVLAVTGPFQWQQATSSDARTLTPVLWQGGYPEAVDAVTEYVALTPGTALLRSSQQLGDAVESWEVVVHVVAAPSTTTG